MKRNSQFWHNHKGLRAVLTIILFLLLLASEGALMGLCSVDNALTEESIEEELIDSRVINEYLDEALANSTVNNGGRYGEIISAVISTDAMNGLFTNYITSAVRNELYGEECEEIGNDELSGAFSQGLEEVQTDGTVSLTTMEEEYIKEQMQQQIPIMTASLNSIIDRYEVGEGEVTQGTMASAQTLQQMMDSQYRILAAALCVILVLCLIALHWTSCFGFLLCGIITAIAATGFMGMNFMVKYFVGDRITYATDAFLVGVVQNGFDSVALVAYIVGAAFIAIYVLLILTKGRGR